jgi:hypothetical protein
MLSVLENESTESRLWFMEMHKLIGILVGPVIHTEAANFMKKFFVC